MSGALPPQQSAMQPPPGMMANPAFAQWEQARQQQQAVIAQNQQLQRQFEVAWALVQRDGLKGFKLEVEADSHIAPDEEAEKSARVEFLQQIVPLLQQAVPLAQGNPKMAKLISEVAMFAVRGFRVARTLEEAFEEAFDVLGQMPPPPPKGGHGAAPPNPLVEGAKIAADVHDTQMKTQAQQAATAAKAQTDQLAIAQKAQQAVMQFQAAQARAASEEMHNQAMLQLEAEKILSQERVAAARVQRSESQSAGTLT